MKKICDNCTSCGLCVLKCPCNAIEFKVNKLFSEAIINETKCINCNLCKKICPVNSENDKNNIKIKIARIKDDKLINLSTSGGIFGCIARYILNNNGIVYGAGYSSDFYEVEHIRIDNIKDLNKILRSKYIKSNTINSYNKVLTDLELNKIVLYSGTPCQIAALKKFLGKDYYNLYTIDLICHGNPSQKIWKKYIQNLEKKENSKVAFIDFRYNNVDNPPKNFLIKFDNGKIINDILYENVYGKAFLIGLINNDCCNNCKFNDFRNQSDITLGDAYGYVNNQYPNKNSLIFLNNNKGSKLYNNIKDQIIEFNDFNKWDLIQNNYPIILSTPKHYNSNKINIESKDIEKELRYWLDTKNGLKKDPKGVGILNFHYENYNYGANLVAYSLSEVVKKIGYNPYVIDFDPFPELDPITRYRTKALYQFRKKYLNMTPTFKDSSELNILNKYFDMFIVGSDQVWRKAITQNNLKTYFLDFVKDKNKLAYGASFGKSEFEGDLFETIECANLLSSFASISVRENDAVDICKNKFNQDTIVVLDPTLLLNREDYEKLIVEEYEKRVDVAVYFVMDSENKIMKNKYLINLFAEKEIVNIKGDFVKKPFGNVFVYNSISKWLDGIRKCEYIVTDSYHGLIFGLIFNKKIILVGKNSAAPSRFTTLFENLKGGLENVNYSDLSEVKNIDYSLNYQEINNNLKKYKASSLKFLKDNLNSNKIKKETNFYKNISSILNKFQNQIKDLENEKNSIASSKDKIIIELYNEINGLNKQNTELINEINSLNKQNTELINEINSIINSNSWKITKPLRKFRNIFKEKNRKM